MSKLTGFSKLTGCDFNPLFLRGKKNIVVIANNIHYQKSFTALGNAEIEEKKCF